MLEMLTQSIVHIFLEHWSGQKGKNFPKLETEVVGDAIEGRCHPSYISGAYIPPHGLINSQRPCCRDAVPFSQVLMKMLHVYIRCTVGMGAEKDSM